MRTASTPAHRRVKIHEGTDMTDSAPAKVTRASATMSGRATARSTPSDEEPTRAERIEINQGGLHTAEAGSISVHQGGMSNAYADAIDITQGGIGRARATDIAVSQGGIGLAQGDKVSVDQGLVGAAFGTETRLVQSMSNVAMGTETTVDQSIVGTIVAGHVTVRQPSAIGILIAGRIEGSVRPILDWRGAAALGAAFALVMGLLRRARP
jgi:hypothetical protein